MIEGEEMSSTSGGGFNPIGARRPGGRDRARGGHVGPGAPVAAGQDGARARVIRTPRSDAGSRLHDERDPPPERDRDRRRARHAHLRRGARAHQRARERVARRRARRGRRRRDHVPQPPRLHRGHRRRVEDRCARPLPEHGVRRSAAHRGRPAREADGDRLRPGVRRAARGRGQAPQALHRLGRRRLAARPDARGADRVRRHRVARAARRARPRSHPDLGHDRHAEGRRPQAARRTQPGDRAAVADPAEGGRAHDDRRAAVPLVGLRALHARAGAPLHLRAAAQVRPRGHAVRDRPARVHVVPDGPGDAPAHPRAARGGAQRSTTCRRCAQFPCPGSALPGDLAIKFMDEFGDVVFNLYGSTEVAWATIATPADLRAAPGHRRQAAARHDAQDLRRERPRAAARRDRPHLRRRTRCCSRATRAAARRT